MNKYKYVHIIWANEFKFSTPLLDLFSRNKRILKSEEHIFVTPHKQVYDALNKYGNVIWDSSKDNLFNKYASRARWIISHDFPNKKIVLKIKKKYKKKIVFRYWGGRRNLIEKIPGNFFHNIKAIIMNKGYQIAFRFIYDNLAMIGIANLVDEIDLKQLIRKTPMMRMPYINYGSFDLISKIKKEKIVTHEKLNVMIGHRSEPLEHHIKYLELLRKFPQVHMMIYVPLSYGDKTYAKSVIDYVKENQFSNVVLITDFIEFSDYVRLLSKMDIALVDCENSLALGNIDLLLSFNKTIYLSRTGVIKKAFDYNNIPHHCLDEINDMSFADFSTLLKLDDSQGGDLREREYNYCVNLWKEVLDYLSEKEND